MKKTTNVFWAGVLVLGLSGTAQATLYDRGGGMIYDSDQNLTWLQDANYAQTSGHDTDGRMGWDAAMAWAAGLSYGGYNDWRLPTVTPSNDTWANSGTDRGYNVNTANSELAYMFHDILGNESWLNPDGTLNAAGCPDAAPYCLQNTGADGVNFANLQSSSYWSGTEYAPSSANFAWGFYNDSGSQSYRTKVDSLGAWAVRSGDVAVVPVPAAVWLFSTGLLGLLGVGRWRRR